MTKEELAEQFASEQVAEITEKLKAAYLKGYEQGELKSASTIKIDGVEYVDLGLPSGTLWSKHTLIQKNSCAMLGYHEAQKLNIPTKEQVDELIAHTMILRRDFYFDIIGPNSNKIFYCILDLGEGLDSKKSYRCLWVKAEADTDNHAPILCLNGNVSRHFTGFKLPVFLVKNKAEL